MGLLEGVFPTKSIWGMIKLFTQRLGHSLLGFVGLKQTLSSHWQGILSVLKIFLFEPIELPVFPQWVLVEHLSRSCPTSISDMVCNSHSLGWASQLWRIGQIQYTGLDPKLNFPVAKWNFPASHCILLKLQLLGNSRPWEWHERCLQQEGGTGGNCQFSLGSTHWVLLCM